jgi:cation diffusion facilitator family transporter
MTARLTWANLGVSALLVAVLGAAWWASSSQLALAQASDALTDTFVTVALLWALRLAEKPPDEDHPFGHDGAEPLAALLAAAVAAVLAVEVLRSAIGTLVEGRQATLSLPIALAFGLRVLLRGAVVALAARARRAPNPTPALDALFVDARNDVVVALLALLGFGLARAGWPTLDAWAALPLGLWVGFSGLALARENVALLMGAAPSDARQAELVAIVRDVPGVRRARHLRARSQGSRLFVWVAITVDPALGVVEAHDLGERVEAALEAEGDVAEAVVHVEPHPRPSAARAEPSGPAAKP